MANELIPLEKMRRRRIAEEAELLREELGLSQRVFAERIDISEASYNKFVGNRSESGTGKNIVNKVDAFIKRTREQINITQEEKLAPMILACKTPEDTLPIIEVLLASITRLLRDESASNKLKAKAIVDGFESILTRWGGDLAKLIEK